jgi:phosphotransferase family enzyme
VTAPATARVGAHGATAALNVADLCDTERMTAELRPLLARGQPCGAGARVVSARLLAYAPGRRAVMSYQVRDGEPARTTELIAKAFTESWRAAVLHANLQQMTRAIAGVGDPPVPAVVGLLPERGLVVYHAADGMPLDRLGTGRVEGARAAARWLATVHGSDARLSRRLDMAVEASSCRQWAARIAAQLPSLLAPARDLAARWSEVAATTRVCTDVPMHKDFHPGHVLVRADGVVTVLDVDEARMGDPALDVAHFCAYLQLGGAPAAVERAFLDQYDVLAGAETGPFGREWDRAFALFSAYSWLKIAKQLASGSGPCPVGEDARADAVAHALRRGSACLGK